MAWTVSSGTRRGSWRARMTGKETLYKPYLVHCHFGRMAGGRTRPVLSPRCVKAGQTLHRSAQADAQPKCQIAGVAQCAVAWWFATECRLAEEGSRSGKRIV